MWYVFQILSDNGNLTEPQVVEVLTALLPAVEYLHSQSVIHRDIKPENIVFMRNGALKLADLGSAINIRDERPVSRLGTLDYMVSSLFSSRLCRVTVHLPLVAKG